MRWLGYREIALKSIIVDAADIRRRMSAASVTDLAANIRQHGDEPIHAPTIRMPSRELLCGRDRMGAMLILKAKKLWVRLAQCTDEEAADLKASENIFRRADDRNEELAAAVAAKEALLRARRTRDNVPGPGSASNRPPPSEKTIKAQARKEVARDAGVTTESVRKAEQRAAAARAEEPSEPAPEPPFPDNLNVLGIEDNSTRAVCKFARPVQDAIDEADKYLRLAVAALKPIELTPLGQELRDQAKRVGEFVRSQRPAALCPWCKGLPMATLGYRCNVCTSGYVTAEKAGRAPKEALRLPPIVIVHGRDYPYADVRDGKVKPGAAPKSGKHLSSAR